MFSAAVPTGVGAGGPVEIPFGMYYNLMMDWKVVLGVCGVYLASVQAYNNSRKKRSIKKGSESAESNSVSESSVLRGLILLHNISLSLFSAKVFISVLSGWIGNLLTSTLRRTYCDHDSEIWNGFLFYWTWLFYLSKYYEFVDTFILMIKGKKVTTLQSYHHAGAVISMWLIVAGSAAGSWAFVIFNSFVHTIMYCYYALTTIRIKPRYKSMLTTLQIVQFLLGLPLSISYIFIPNCLRKLPGMEHRELAAYSFVTLYLVPLIHMFVQFARRTFAPHRATSASTKTK